MYNSKSDRTLKKGRICKEEKGKNREIKSEEEEKGRAKKKSQTREYFLPCLRKTVFR